MRTDPGAVVWTTLNRLVVGVRHPGIHTEIRPILQVQHQSAILHRLIGRLQKKTLLGARADYRLDDRLADGATLMRMTQKSPIDKFRIGEEPVSNTIWGIDGWYRGEPRWLTRVVVALPLIQKKERSTLSLTGEFAKLLQNLVESIAFERTRRDLRNIRRDFN